RIPMRSVRRASERSGTWALASGSSRLPLATLRFMRGRGLAHPGAIVPRLAPSLHPLLGDRAFAADDCVEFFPIYVAEIVAALLLVPLEVGVRDCELEEVRLRYGNVDELLAKLIIGLALDPPTHRLSRVGAVGVRRSEHHQARPPPAVERILRHPLLLRRAVRHRNHDLVALALVEALFLANAHHCASIRPVARPLQRYLVHDRRAVDEPADRANIRPGKRRVIENGRVLRLAGVQRFDHLLAARPERLRSTIEIQPVTGLVLYLREQDR